MIDEEMLKQAADLSQQLEESALVLAQALRSWESAKRKRRYARDRVAPPIQGATGVADSIVRYADASAAAAKKRRAFLVAVEDYKATSAAHDYHRSLANKQKRSDPPK